jgi:DNA-binding transcriptional ArsR family regulator
MPDKRQVPDYELADTVELTTAEQVRAISDPLRTTILGLLHERAATVTELATAVGRPKSTVAHHVKVLADAGILRVVRTRRVRAIEERFYGRAARMFFVGLGRQGADGQLPHDFNDFEVAAQ